MAVVLGAIRGAWKPKVFFFVCMTKTMFGGPTKIGPAPSKARGLAEIRFAQTKRALFKKSTGNLYFFVLFVLFHVAFRIFSVFFCIILRFRTDKTYVVQKKYGKSVLFVLFVLFQIAFLIFPYFFVLCCIVWYCRCICCMFLFSLVLNVFFW